MNLVPSHRRVSTSSPPRLTVGPSRAIAWLVVLSSTLLTIALVPSPSLGQLEEEDLSAFDPVVPPQALAAFDEAVELFGTTDQADAIPLFGAIIEELSAGALAGDDQALDLLSRSLLYRARAHFNFGDNDLAEADLTRLIELSPTATLSQDEVSSRLYQLFERLRNERVGQVTFLVLPADTEIRIDGEPLASEGTQTLLAGAHTAELRRPGHLPTNITFELAGGAEETIEAELERVSAAMRLRTQPTGAQVLVDGVMVGETQGQAEPTFVPRGDLARADPRDFSELLWIDDIDSGRHEIEIRKPGFRSYRAALTVDQPRDFLIEPIVLEPETGQLVMLNLPGDAVVSLDGQRMRPDRESGRAQLVLPPGSYVLSVNRGASGRFETSVDIVDRGTVEVAVELKPALVLVDILGDDDVGAERLRSGLDDAFRARSGWTLLNRTEPGEPLAQRLGLSKQTLRRFASEPGAINDVDWAEAQKALDAELAGSAFLIAVLTDDLVAEDADLWIVAASPGPKTPERRRVALSDPEDLAGFAAAFPASPSPIRASLGVRTIDSALAAGPVVVDLLAGGAAAEAGLQIGDAITAVGGTASTGRRELSTLLGRHEAGESVDLEIVRAGTRQQVRATLQRSLWTIDPNDDELVTAAFSSALAAELDRESEWPRWLLELNQALLLLRVGENEEAVRVLRRIDLATVPSSAGLGRAAVQYALGVALLRASPRYADLARETFERVIQQGGRQTLIDDDGPLAAPRARARLAGLGVQ